MNVLDSTPAGATLNFSQRVSQSRMGPRQFLVILSLSLLVLFDGMDTQVLGLIAHDLTRDIGLPLSTFGVVFSSGLIGGIVGAMLMSPAADQWLGRKRVLTTAMGLAGACTVLTAHAGTLAELVLVRFLTGVGLGAAVPNIITLAAEFSPARLSRRVVSTMVALMPLGSLLGGLLARGILPRSDWRMLLNVAGIGTLALVVAAALIVPESVQFLVRRKRDQKRAISAVGKLFSTAGISVVTLDDNDGGDPKNSKQPVASLFTFGLWKLTLLFWLLQIMNQAILYFVLSWTPALLLKSGMSSTAGMDAAAMFGLGGAIGTVAQGWLTTRFGIYKVMFAEIGLYIAAILTLPLALGNAQVAPVIIFVIAATICAYHAGALLLIVESNPEAIRSTAFGWAFGVGRVGASGAPALAGFLLHIGWSPALLFTGAAVPGIVTGVALLGISIVVVQRARGQETPYVRASRIA
jgi:AAHS family 4-hydroxybenzoate transporter-like MFS transporter